MFAVTILGNNSALPMHDRHPTSQVVTLEEHMFLVDCGEGTQMQMNRYKIRRSRIRHIFISHLHGDHYFGLPGLLNSYALNGRTDALHLYAPPQMKQILDIQFQSAGTVLSYPLHFFPLEREGLIADEKKFTVECFEVYHRIPCWGFLFREKPKPRKLVSEMLQQYNIPAYYYKHLKEGADYTGKDGELIRNDRVTKPAPPPSSYAFCADTIFDERIAAKIKNVDLVYHEATYLHELEERASSRFHATARQAATIASLAGAKNLLIGHFSSKYDILDPFLEEAAAVFPNTELALEGVTYRIPQEHTLAENKTQR